MHIYSPVTGQRQTLTIGQSANFFCNDFFILVGIRTCLGVSSDPMFVWISSNSCLVILAACSKPPSRNNRRKGSHPNTQEPDQGAC